MRAGDADFDRVAGAADLPVLVDLWAPWCGPCRVVGPHVDRAAVDFAGRLKVVKVNVDEAPGTAGRFGVRSIPTLLLLDHGRVLSRQVGAPSPTQLRSWIEGTLGQRSTASA
jgi:thioredoxin 2